MARKPMTEEQIDVKIATEMAALTSLRADYKRISDGIGRKVASLKKLQEAKQAFTPLTLETALVVYLETGENSLGYQWLQDKSWKGEWKDTGMRFNGGYWQETNQRVMTVWSDHSWDDAKLAVQEKTILEVLPAIQAGIIGESQMIKLSKSESADINEMQVMEIFDRGLSAHSSWKLGAMADGRWVIFDIYSCKYSWGEARMVGTLMDCLKEIRQNLYYEGPRDDDDDCHC